ncbi:MAG: 30S ribosomal protein S12 methylthiotransferase RimO [Candidatus Desulfofervidaceae bacterium]|nr:30S ribosomal protein S12 methylthiotransferase RimO [Candidatus Desulfofervidaceae bacterium]
MQKIYFLSLGCPKNLVDSEILSALLHEVHFEIVEDPSIADILLISTCAFIKPAIEESIEAILELAQIKQPGQRLIVIGCLVERYKEELIPLLPEVDAWLGFKALPALPRWLRQSSLPRFVLEGPGWHREDYLKRMPSHPFTAYVKIAEGCSNYCTFCTIPAIRGKLASRPMEDISKEVEALVAQGVKEIILVAQETTAYGMDIYGRPCLAELLQRLDTSGVTWLRVLYAHPKRVIPLIEAFSSCKHLTPYLDVPIQHIDSQVLKTMGRGMNEEEVRRTLLRFKETLPQVKLRTTVMVGFPTETEAAFKRLVDFVKEMEFDYLGVFKYFPEEGTPAFKMGDIIPDEVKEERYQTILDLQYQIVRKKYQNYIGHIERVFIDRIEEGYAGVGRTSWQAPEIDGEVYITEGEAFLGEIKPVKIIDTYDYDLIGIVLPDNPFLE